MRHCRRTTCSRAAWRVAKDNANTPLRKYSSGTVAPWHKSGELIGLEDK